VDHFDAALHATPVVVEGDGEVNSERGVAPYLLS